MHQAGAEGGGSCEGIEWRRSALRRHLHLIDGTVGVEGDGLYAGHAHGATVVGGAVVEHIPLSFVFHERAVVVPRLGVAPVVVDDDAFILVGSQRLRAHGVTQRRGAAAAADVGKEEVVVRSALHHVATLVEVVVALGDDAVAQRREVERAHVGIHLRPFGGKLSPEVVSLSVVVDEDVRVNLLRAVDARGMGERSCRTAPRGHELVSLWVVEVEVVGAVAPYEVGGVEAVLPAERIAVQRPLPQVAAAQHVVALGAVVVGRLVERTVDIQPPVAVDACSRVSDVNPLGRYRVLCRHRQGC